MHAYIWDLSVCSRQAYIYLDECKCGTDKEGMRDTFCCAKSVPLALNLKSIENLRDFTGESHIAFALLATLPQDMRCQRDRDTSCGLSFQSERA